MTLVPPAAAPAVVESATPVTLPTGLPTGEGATPAEAPPPPAGAGETPAPAAPAVPAAEGAAPSSTSSASGVPSEAAVFYGKVQELAAQDPRVGALLDNPVELASILSDRDTYFATVERLKTSPHEVVGDLIKESPAMLTTVYQNAPPEAQQAITQQVLRGQWTQLQEVAARQAPSEAVVKILRETAGNESLPMEARQAAVQQIDALYQPVYRVKAAMHAIEMALQGDKARSFDTYVADGPLAPFWESAAAPAAAAAADGGLDQYQAAIRDGFEGAYLEMVEKHVEIPASVSPQVKAAFVRELYKAARAKMDENPNLGALATLELRQDRLVQRPPGESRSLRLLTQELRKALLGVRKEVAEAFFQSPAAAAGGGGTPAAPAASGTPVAATPPPAPAPEAPTKAMYTKNGRFDVAAFNAHYNQWIQQMFKPKS